MYKKVISVLVLAVLLLTTIVSCSKPAETPSEPIGGDAASPSDQVTEEESTEPVAETPMRDTLVVALPADPPSLDPVLSGGRGCMRVLKQIYENLVTIDASGNYAPGLADSWEVSDDGTEYIFHLKKGVYFHNGEELSADDVVFSTIRGKESAYLGAIWAPVDYAEVIDQYTVKVVLKYPYAAFLGAMGGPGGAAITNRKAVEDGGENYGQHGIGTGPYKVVEWITGDRVVLVANENWHGGEVPIKNLIFKIITDPSTAAIALEKGEVDVMIEVNDIDKPNIKANPELKLYEVPSYQVSYVGMNTEAEHFSDKLVRQAIALVIDKEGALLAVKEGNGTIAQNFLVNGLFGYDSSVIGPDLNIERAKELMAEAGLADGFATTIITKDGPDRKLAQVVQENLTKINIEAEIQVLETSAFTDTAKKGDYKMMINTWSSPVSDADYSLFFLFHPSNIGGMNFTRINDPVIEEYLDLGRNINDVDQRREAYSNLLKALIDIVPAVPVYFEVSAIAANAELKGIVPDPTTEYRYVNFYW